MQSNLPPHRKEAQFALAALMEIPLQYKATIELQLLGRRRGTSPGVQPLPPPPMVLQMEGQAFGHSLSYGHPPPPPMSPTSPYMPPAAPNAYAQYGGYYPPPPASAPPIPNSQAPDGEVAECPVCLTDKKDVAFNCGHQTCRQCATNLTHCPICRGAITSRVRLY
jgi:E3 ubiquitin-protein ligase RGLG